MKTPPSHPGPAPAVRGVKTGRRGDREGQRQRQDEPRSPKPGNAKRRTKRKWTKRKVRVRVAVVSQAGVESITREWRRWLWQAYRRADLSLEDVAAEIGATRQGFTNLLVEQRSRLFFDTFLRACFLRRETENGFTIVVEGWKVQLRWTVERCNRGCVSSLSGRA